MVGKEKALPFQNRSTQGGHTGPSPEPSAELDLNVPSCFMDFKPDEKTLGVAKMRIKID